MPNAIPQEKKKPSAVAKSIAAIVGIPIVIGLMLWAFLAPTFASGPAGVPIALSAPEPMQDSIVQKIEEGAGEDAPDIVVKHGEEEVRDAVLNREAVGGLVLAPEGGEGVYGLRKWCPLCSAYRRHCEPA